VIVQLPDVWRHSGGRGVRIPPEAIDRGVYSETRRIDDGVPSLQPAPQPTSYLRLSSSILRIVLKTTMGVLDVVPVRNSAFIDSI